jgi:hypothetical protein
MPSMVIKTEKRKEKELKEMSTWDFRRESTATKSGANNVAGILAGYQPFAEADNIASKTKCYRNFKGLGTSSK